LLTGSSAHQQDAWLRRQVVPSEIVSLSHLQAMITDMPGEPTSAGEAGGLLGQILETRLRRGLRTVLNAPGMHPAHLEEIRLMADRFGRPVALFIQEPDPAVPTPLQDRLQLMRMASGREWTCVWQIRSTTRLDWAACAPYPTATSWVVAGDIHGCLASWIALIEQSGGRVLYNDDGLAVDVQMPDGVRLASVGDLINRGTHSVEVLELAIRLHQRGKLVVVPGNHDLALASALISGEGASESRTETQLRLTRSARDLQQIGQWILNLSPYVVLRHSNGLQELVMSHAGLERGMVGRTDGWIRWRCAHGRPQWEAQQYGFDEDHFSFPWQQDYDEDRQLVHGHWARPSATVRPRGSTWNVDTNAVRGGRLSAFVWPECTVLSVEGQRQEVAVDESGNDVSGSPEAPHTMSTAETSTGPAGHGDPS